MLHLRINWTMVAFLTFCLGHGRTTWMASHGSSSIMCSQSCRMGFCSLMTCGNLGQVTRFISCFLFISMLGVCFETQPFWTKHSVIQNAPRWFRRMGSLYVEVVRRSCQWRPLLGLLQEQCLAFEMWTPAFFVFFTSCKLRCLGWPRFRDSEGSWSSIRVCKASATYET